MKPVCIVVGNVVIDGDVCLIDKYRSDMDVAIFIDWDRNSANFIGKGMFFCNQFNLNMPIKIMLLWIWHITILRKTHVYLTGVLK